MDTSGHLIVDGCNILHAWPSFRGLLRGHLDAATERLLQTVRILHDFEGNALTLVFDGRGRTLSLLNPDGMDSLTVVYSPAGTTADAIIEQLLGRTPSTEGWVVATGDGAIAQTARSYGARSITPQELAEWIAAVESRQSAWLARRRKPID